MIALPALESLGFRRFASAASQSVLSKKRMIFLGFGYGITNETWFPDVKQTGRDYKLPPGLEPLARHQNDFTVIQGLWNKHNNEGHWGSTFWLTGANRYAEPGRNFHNSISADQVAAAVLGKDTRYTSIQLNTSDKEAGHGPGLSMAWDANGKPVGGFDNPVVAFHKLFSDDDTPLEKRQALIAKKRSVLDVVLQDAKSVQRGLNKTDADKLQEYLQGIRDIETRLSKDEKWLNIPRAKPPIPEPAPSMEGKEEIKLMYDLIVAAFQTDTTRVATYRQPVDTLLKSLDSKINSHDMSHYAPGERMEASQKRDLAQSTLLAGLMDKLKATKEADGSTLFDHTCLAYGSNIRTVHNLDNCPTIIAGKGGGIRLGEHVVLKDKNTPLSNLWLTLLNGTGISVKSHGESTGMIKDIVA